MAKIALAFAILGLLLGVFFREYTKYMEYTGDTVLSVMHTHTLVLGVFFTLIVALGVGYVRKSITLLKKPLWFYYIGLIVLLVMMFIRGLTQVSQTVLTDGMNGAISGIAGLGHILLTVGFLWILIKFVKRFPKDL